MDMVTVRLFRRFAMQMKHHLSYFGTRPSLITDYQYAAAAR